MEILQTFGSNVKRLRLRKCISQEKLAEMCGLHRTYISDIERYKRNVSIKNIQIISECLGVEICELFLVSEIGK